MDQFLRDGGAPVGVGRRVIALLRAATPRFDANHNGTLDPEERALMLQFLAARIRERVLL